MQRTAHQCWQAAVYVQGTFHLNTSMHRHTHIKSGGHYLSCEPSACQRFKSVQQTNLLPLPLLYTEVEWKLFLGIFFSFLNLVLYERKKTNSACRTQLGYYFIIFHSSNPRSSFKTHWIQGITNESDVTFPTLSQDVKLYSICITFFSFIMYEWRWQMNRYVTGRDLLSVQNHSHTHVNTHQKHVA